MPAQFGVRVRMVAPFDVRVNRIALANGLTTGAADPLVAKVDHERKDFIRDQFQKDPRDPMNYDLVINTSALTVEGTAAIVMAALRQKLQVVPGAVSAP